MASSTGRTAVVAISLLLVVVPLLAGPKADLIFVHGRIYQPARSEGGDCAKQPAPGYRRACRSHSYAEALAVEGGKVVAVGDTKSILRWKGKSTIVIDLQGQ